MRWRHKWLDHFAKIAFIVLLFAWIETSPIHDYIQIVKGNSSTTIATTNMSALIYEQEGHKRQGDLLQNIREQAKSLYEAPLDAKVDPIWKAIPGYNGIEVDIERTYEWNIKHPAEKITFLYREVKPQVSLEDLGPYPIYRGNVNKKMAAIMINVAWGNEYLPDMLTILQNENVKATFFFDGSWLSRNIEIARQICKLGHECSNHAYSHKNMSELNRQQAKKEIQRTEQLLSEKLGVQNRWFAPPSGDYNQETVEVAYDLGLRTVLWTIDTVDWKQPKPEWIVRKIAAALEPGSLILMHPTPSSSQALEEMIHHIKQEGYVLGTVSEVLSSERIANIEQMLYF